MSFDDYRSNRDPVLEAALCFSDDEFILDPIAYLTELYKAQKLDELKSEAARLAKDPNYRYLDFEAEFNKVGYELLGDNQLEAAIFVFQQNNELFPQSANTWDSLAEALWKAKQTVKAIECYNQAIELDPEGSVGANARNMLKQIEAKSDQTEK